MCSNEVGKPSTGPVHLIYTGLMISNVSQSRLHIQSRALVLSLMDFGGLLASSRGLVLEDHLTRARRGEEGDRRDEEMLFRRSMARKEKTGYRESAEQDEKRALKGFQLAQRQKKLSREEKDSRSRG